MKLSEAYARYAAESGALNSEQSHRTYRKNIRQLIDYAGDKALGSYTLDELTAFCLGVGGRGKAPATVSLRRTVLCSVFGWCHFHKLVARDPTVDLTYTVKPRKGGVVEHHWLTKADTAEIAKRFNLEDPRGHRDYAVYRTTLMLGLRRSETASLRWSSFRPDLSTVTLTGKGNKVATLALPRVLRDILGSWRRLQPGDAVPFPRFRYEHDFHGHWRILPQWTTPITGWGVYGIIRQYAHVPPHDLRRSFAGILEADGVSLKDVQGLMRHEGLATTDRYLERSPARLAEVVEGVDWG